jgi:hypothetical protein
LFPNLAEWTSGLLSLPEELKQETDHYIVSQPGQMGFLSALAIWYFRSNFPSGGTKIGNSFLYHFPRMVGEKEI